jgi:phosphatidylserine/phosphatidylglycerophosphate/cardiolipin synthase-like enzyme
MASEPAAAPLIREFVSMLSPEFVQRFVRLLRSHASLADVTRARIMREVANDNACERIASLVTVLSAVRPDISPEVVAFGIDCALEAAEFESRAQSVDLVWTGPETSDVSVRRGAAVLLELIESAQTDLIIMSFASFRIPDADAALSRAADRGVRMYLILESEEGQLWAVPSIRRAGVWRSRTQSTRLVLLLAKGKEAARRLAAREGCRRRR